MKKPVIFAVGGQKGGTGKSTTALNLAVCMAMRNLKVLLVDTDRQGTLLDWDSVSDNELLPVVGITTGNIKKQLTAIYEPYDYVVIDGSPRLESEFANILSMADVYLIPVKTSPPDVWSQNQIIEAVESQTTLRGMVARFVLTDVVQSRKIIIDETIKAINETPIPLLDTWLISRTAFMNTVGYGGCALHSDDPKAMAEVETLTTEILSLLPTTTSDDHKPLELIE